MKEERGLPFVLGNGQLSLINKQVLLHIGDWSSILLKLANLGDTRRVGFYIHSPCCQTLASFPPCFYRPCAGQPRYMCGTNLPQTLTFCASGRRKAIPLHSSHLQKNKVHSRACFKVQLFSTLHGMPPIASPPQLRRAALCFHQDAQHVLPFLRQEMNRTGVYHLSQRLSRPWKGWEMFIAVSRHQGYLGKERLWV